MSDASDYGADAAIRRGFSSQFRAIAAHYPGDPPHRGRAGNCRCGKHVNSGGWLDLSITRSSPPVSETRGIMAEAAWNDEPKGYAETTVAGPHRRPPVQER